MFKEDFERRIKMFVALVESVAMYGAEIWGWNDEGRLDIIKRRYMKWILGLDKVTPNYILREETREEEIRTKAVRSAFNYEEGARSSDKKLVRECIRKMERQREEKKPSKWKERRAGLKGRLGINEDWMGRVREGEEGKTEGVAKRVRKRIEEVEGESRRKKIEESKYNAHYKEIATKERPEDP